MPAAGTRQQPSQPKDPPTGDQQITPDAVLSEFGQLCVALPAAGAVVAVRQMTGLRCTVSFGNAPAVGFRLSTDSAFTTHCMDTGEVVLCQDVASDPRIPPAVAASSDFGSAVTVPIQAQGSIVGLIQVFCAQPRAINPTAIASLQSVARSFAALMIFDAANDGPPIIGGPLDHPIVLPRLFAVPKLPAVAHPAPEVSRDAGKQEINNAVSTARAVTAAKDTKPRSGARATISRLPSDKPTPTRVWYITAALLVVLSLLLLLLFKSVYHTQNESLDNPAPAAAAAATD